jgi:hypothetical protein
LETVQEEETPAQTEEVEKLEIKEESDTTETGKLRTSAIIEAQLYDELSELKPIVSKKFLTSANICLNTASVETVDTGSTQATTTTTSMVITPTYTTTPEHLNNAAQVENLKNNSIQINFSNGAARIQPSQQQKPFGVRFSDMPNVYTKSTRILTNGSMISKSSESETTSSDLGSNSSSSTSISNESGISQRAVGSDEVTSVAPSVQQQQQQQPIVTSSLVRSRNLIATNVSAASGSLLVPRRYSTVITASNTLMQTGNVNVACLPSNNPRRVSLSVTDL